MERATLIGKSMGGHRESHLIFYEVPLDEKRVIGRAWLLFWRRIEPPRYPQIPGEHEE